MNHLLLDTNNLADSLAPYITELTWSASFLAWDGEVEVTLHLNHGVYGHFSAAMVVRWIDNPIEAHTYDGYISQLRGLDVTERFKLFKNWFVKELDELLTPKGLNTSGIKGTLNLVSTQQFSHENCDIETTNW